MRKTTAEFKRDVRIALRVLSGSGIPEDILIDMCATHAVGLVEYADQYPEWFEDKAPTEAKE